MNIEDSFKCIDIFFRDNPSLVVKHHIDSYNKFFQKDLREIMMDNNPKTFITELDKETNKYKYTAEMYYGGKNGDKIYYGKPIIYDSKDLEERAHYMYPNEARLRNMTYYFTIHYDIDIDFKILIQSEDGKEGESKFREVNITKTIEKVLLGKFPLMVKSYLCLLNKLSDSACFNLGECRNDKGGYFIIDGKERSIVSQEGRANNILYVKSDVNEVYSHAAEIRSVSEDASKPIRTLSVRIVREQPSRKNNNIVVNVPNVRKPVPLFILMRALGVISDKEIIETCLLDLEAHKELHELFIPSIYDAGHVFTQQAALKYMATLTKGKTINHVVDILMNYFLPHIGELNFKHKALYVGYIVKRLLMVYIKAELPTNRDKYNAKRIEHTGILIAELFREYYKKQLNDINLKIDNEYFFKNNSVAYQNENFPNLITNNIDLVFSEKLVQEGFRKAFKGNWGADAHTKRVGIVQTLNRLSFFSFMCQLRKTNLPMGDGVKMIEPRLLNGTQYGLLCPVHSPDGGNIGLHKHMATSVHITNGVSAKPYIKYLRNLNMLLLEECSYKRLATLTKIFINGAWVGCAEDPLKIVKKMKLDRRNNLIYTYASILFNIKHNEIQIWLDAGRLCRPLFYVDKNGPSCSRTDFQDKLRNDKITWREMICGFNKKSGEMKYSDILLDTSISEEELSKNSAVIDYIDASEGEGMKLLKSSGTIEEIDRETHIEIHPSLILGFMGNQIIYPENNPYPRNAFSCGQAKQGVSLYNTNYQNRIDKTSLVLNYGQLPLTKSRYLKYFTNEEHPYGENAIVAVMCYSGYNVEDAIIFNEGSLKRGLFSTTYYNMYEDREESSKISNTKVDSQFMNIEDNNVIGIREGFDYSKLDKETGLIKENTILTEKTIMIGKASNSLEEPDMFIDASVKCKKGQTGIVDKSFMTEGEEGQRIAKVRVRASRIPQIGDKFCSRAGQKGTVGIILPEVDMPTTADGLKPDIIVNPHAMPSRMTIGHLVEALISKSASIIGGFGDCTAFLNKGPKDKIFGKVLTDNGYHSSGNEILYNGMTGEQLETEIYIGPTYYLRLKHMPKDKINYRARGPRSVLTRQTVGGRANDGGLRIGEMDRDCLIAHGMTNFIKESMLVRGDEYYMAVCNQTGTIAVYNESKNIFLSPMIDGPLKYVGNLDNEKNIVQKSRFGRDFSIVRVPYAFKLLMQELKTMNVQMRIITEDNVDKMTSLYKGEANTISGFKNEKMKVAEGGPKTPDSKDYSRDEYPEIYRNSLDEFEVYGEEDREPAFMGRDIAELSPEIIVDGIVKVRTRKGITKNNFKILEINNENNEVVLLRLEPFEEIIYVNRVNIVLAPGQGEGNKLNIIEEGDEEEGDEEEGDEEEGDEEEEEIEVYEGKNEKEIRDDMQNLAEEAVIGSNVKIMTNRGVSKDNFEIMGQSTTTREFTLRNKNSGMITTRHVREILLKDSSLKDPNKLDIGDTINLQVDELPSPEIDKDFKPDMESFENIGTEELNIEEFDSEDDMSPVDNWYPQQTESKKDIHQEKKIKPDSDVESELKLLSVDSSDDVNVVDLSKEKNDDDDNSKLKQIS